ncbi:acyl-CoA Delta-9 desaturase-like [Periplaneta americana]|uniref:acyl-CoA Delta-9 desaturase-like n=1 Tax=Periplaneta americana TaxID=6978 RepID=UPI0037E8E606
MAPNLTTTTALFLTEDVYKSSEPSTSGTRSRGNEKKTEEQLGQELEKKQEEQPQYEWNIRWRNVIAFIYLHVFAVYGIYLAFTTAQWKTVIWAVWLAIFSAVGVTGGAHRLWCHRAYKAKWPLRLILCILQTAAFQNHIYEWVRDHRVHHKFTDTDADPHNSRRGFFFCHIGWLMVRKHPDVKNKGKTVDMSDLLEDPIVVWQMRTYLVTMPLLCFVIPAWIPVYFWGEDPWVSWYVASIMRYTLSLNGTWLVNSAAHMWGTKPYDKNITAVENTFVGIFGIGEGWHNYHHTFPWDYKAAELGRYAANLTTGVIDFFSLFGWAYDLKTVSEEMIRKRSARTGDGSSSDSTDHHDHDHDHANMVWGWGDKDMAEEDRKAAEIYNKSD